MKVAYDWGKGPVTKSDDFLEKFQTAFEIMLQLFYNGYGCIYALGIGQIASVDIS